MRSVFFFSAVVGVTAFAPQRLPAFGCPVCGGGDACVCGLPLTTAAATRRGRGGKIYIGEPEPLEELIDTIGGARPASRSASPRRRGRAISVRRLSPAAL